jgi:hypothetical protein
MCVLAGFANGVGRIAAWAGRVTILPNLLG